MQVMLILGWGMMDPSSNVPWKHEVHEMLIKWSPQAIVTKPHPKMAHYDENSGHFSYSDHF